jgi:hypothetical protein
MTQAIFLSYATQDADAARRICEASRAAGLELCFDQSELTGGDDQNAVARRGSRRCAQRASRRGHRTHDGTRARRETCFTQAKHSGAGPRSAGLAGIDPDDGRRRVGDGGSNMSIRRKARAAPNAIPNTKP